MSDNKRRLHRNLYKNQLVFADHITDLEYCLYEEKDYAILMIPADPRWNGNLNTPVISKLFEYFDKSHIDTMRFTFTKYQIFNNNYDKYITQAAICLEELLKTISGRKKIWLIGFSFGSLVALNLSLRRPDIQGIIAISPPILNYDFLSWFIPFKTNILIAYGENDHLLPGEIINHYTKYLINSKMNVETIAYKTGHDFAGAETALARDCIEFINNNLYNEEEELGEIEEEDDDDDI